MGVLDDAIREHLELKRRHGASDEEITRAEQDALGPARRDLIEPAEGEAGLVPDQTAHVPHGDPIAPQEHAAPVEDAAEPGAGAGGLEVGAPEPVAAAPTEYLPLDDHADDAAAALDGPTFRPVEEASLAEEPIVEGDAEPEAATIDAGPQPPIEPEPAYEEPTVPHEPAPHIEEPAHEDPHALHPEEPHRQGDPLVEEEHHVEEHELQEAEHHFEEDTAEQPHEEPPAPPAEEERNERDDLLEDTPDFLQETPEHDRLWFEQRPPREFDFDE
jgi:hypothetical protein